MAVYEDWEVMREFYDGPLEPGRYVVKLVGDDIVGVHYCDGLRLPIDYCDLVYCSSDDLPTKLSKVRRKTPFGARLVVTIDDPTITLLRMHSERIRPHGSDRLSLWVGAGVLLAIFNPFTLIFAFILVANAL